MWRTSRRAPIILAAMLALLLPGIARAQTATPTSTATPTPTFTLTPEAPKSQWSEDRSVALLTAAASVSDSGGRFVGQWPNKSVQVCAAAGTCTSYSLSIEGSNGGTQYVAIGAAITNSDAGQGACMLRTVTDPVRMLRVRITAINTCSLTVYLHGAK